MLRLSPIPKDAHGVTVLQQLLQEAPEYARIATGEIASPTAADAMFRALPPGKNYGDKFVLGAYEDELLIGCVDLIRGYPSQSVAYIGLLLVAERSTGKGYGTKIFDLICEIVIQWNCSNMIQLGILKTNPGAMRFWQKLGFKSTGESKPYESGKTRTQVLIYQRMVPTAA